MISKRHIPFVSIIVLNYYGEKVISNVINSVQKQNYPKNKFEVIVVDNNSKDNSLNILKEMQTRLSNLRLITISENLGFSKGNNIGIREAKGEYIALLNNDCVVDKNWLKESLRTALKDPKIFATSPKILLYQKYYELNLKLDQGTESFYSFVSKTNLYKFGGKRIYFNTYYTENTLYAQIPYDPVSDTEIEVEIALHTKKKEPSKQISDMPTNIKVLSIKTLKKDIIIKLRIALASKKSLSKIQNAGIIPFQDGYARDIGAIVRDKTQYYEYDDGQYNKELEIYAFCGAAVLMNKKILEEIGYLDETFFMYYEDVELSERARIKGYKVVYSPKAEIRHIHALSSKEGSPFFTYHVERGRLLHVFYNYPFKIFTKQYVKTVFIVIYGLINILMSLKYLKAISKDKSKDKPNFARTFQLIKVLTYFIINSPKFIFVRSKKNYKHTQVLQNYEQVIAGKWYFN